MNLLSCRSSAPQTAQALGESLADLPSGFGPVPELSFRPDSTLNPSFLRLRLRPYFGRISETSSS